MGDTKAKFTDTRTGFIDILMCRYEDEHLALWMKIVFCFIWIISIPNGLIYGVDTDYIMALFSIILILLSFSLLPSYFEILLKNGLAIYPCIQLVKVPI